MADPKHFITYLCLKCWAETYLNELEKAECSGCGNTDNLMIIKKEDLTEAIIIEKLSVVVKKDIARFKKYLLNAEYSDEIEELKLRKAIEKSEKLHNILKSGDFTIEDLNQCL